MRRLAKFYLSRERRDHTLQTTALANETYLRLIPQRENGWQNRAHFIGVAAQVMRRVLVEYARRHHAQKRGANFVILSLAEPGVMALASEKEPPAVDLIDVIALDEALTRLSAAHPRPGRVVEMRYFGGLTEEEIAEVMSVNKTTVTRAWRFAKAWLYRELNGGNGDDR